MGIIVQIFFNYFTIKNPRIGNYRTIADIEDNKLISYIMPSIVKKYL